jgi:hypothetical protein
MPARRQTQLKASIQKDIAMLYEHPVCKFLAPGSDEGWGPVRDLIYGPGCDLEMYLDKFFDADVRQRAAARLAELRALWVELRSDILAAQAQYAPEKKPWGCRFD